MSYRRYANRATLRLAAAKFNEEDHCRDLAGKFTDCVGEGADTRIMGLGRYDSEKEEELFGEMEKADLKPTDAITSIDDDLAGLKKQRTKMRKLVRDTLDMIKFRQKYTGISDSPHRNQKAIDKYERTMEELEAKVNEGAPRLRAVERRMERLEKAREVIGRYERHLDSKRIQRMREARAERLRDPAQRAEFKASMDRLLEARRAYEEAFKKINGHDPDRYDYPARESDVERQLDPDKSR